MSSLRNSGKNTSESTIVITMTRKLIHEQLPLKQHATHLINATTNFKSSEQTVSDFDELKEALNIKMLQNLQLQGAQFDYTMALASIKQPNKFKKYIASSYNKCSSAINKSNITSFDKIFAYSLLLSSAFIYHSDYGSNYIKGLQQIHKILTEINSDHQFRKDLINALQSKVFITHIQRKLLHESICFSIRSNAFIKDIIKRIGDDDDKKEAHLECLTTHWIPRYYDGYYFGAFGDNKKYPVLSTKTLRKIMNADKESHRVCIDDIMIHTHNLSNVAPFIDKYTTNTHHWFNSVGFIDLSCDEDTKINIKIRNHTKSYTMQFNKYDTLNMLKKAINRKGSDIPIAMMRIDYNKQELRGNDTLFDYGIGNNCWLQVSLRTTNPFLNAIS